MARYQIVYCKSSALTQWATTEAEAACKAAALRRAGYYVGVWAHTKAGAHKTAI